MKLAVMPVLRAAFRRAVSLILVCAMLFSGSAQARFISPDDWNPLLPGVGTNRYAYGQNDPVNKADPNGHQSKGHNGGPDFDDDLDNDGIPDDMDRDPEGFGLQFVEPDGQRKDPVAQFGGFIGQAMVVAKPGSADTRQSQVRAAGYQFHHLVPQALSNHPALGLTGFQINSHANRIALPANAGLHRSRTVHSGMHRKEYTERIREVLNDVAARVESGQMTPSQGRAAIESAIAKERKGLLTGATSLNKASDADGSKSGKDVGKGGKGNAKDNE